MSVTVKICGITNLEDARAAADAGADALGFIFYDASPRAVSIETVAQITRELLPTIAKVGVFVNPEEDLVQAAIARGGLNILQFHGEESSDFCRQFGVMSMKAFRVRDTTSLAILSAYETDAFLLDSYVAGKPGGTGELFNWDLAVEAKQFGKPIFLAGGLTPENVAAAVLHVRPFGVDVSSGVEERPGKKDHGKLKEFIAAVKNGTI